MKTRNLTCIVCPRGCQLVVSFDEAGKISEITGNACKRGVTYAENECTHPVRTVTSTVKCLGGRIFSVKTSGTVPKEKVFEVMGVINSTRADNNAKIGDVVIENVLGLGVDVVATSN
ncbi:MAG: DUF1667 domain-containing protein [Clostridia bacterium]|nr:DUF1667 domain-containing protein [Clostridia bacterium]